MPLVNGKNISPDEAILLGLCPECGAPITPREAAAHAASHYFGRDPNDPWLSEEARRRYRLMLDFASARYTATDKAASPPKRTKFSPWPLIIAVPAVVIIVLASEPVIAGVWQFMTALPKNFIAAIAVVGLTVIGLAFFSENAPTQWRMRLKVSAFFALLIEASLFAYAVYFYYPVPSTPGASTATQKNCKSLPITLTKGTGAFVNPCVTPTSNCIASDLTEVNSPLTLRARTAGSVGINGVDNHQVIVTCR